MRQKLLKMVFKRTKTRGQSLILALIVLFFGTLLIVSLLGYMGTGMKTTAQVYDVKAGELYAADAGVVDAEWRIKNGNLDTIYPAFDFINPFPTYTLGNDINDSQVDVKINNVWVPVDIHGNSLTPPSQANAGRLISGVDGNPPKILISSNVMLPSSMEEPGTVEIKVQYYPSGSSENPLISTLGIWLPNGYLYDTATPSTLDSYSGAPTIMTYKGGQAVLWNLNGYPFEGNEAFHQAAFPRDIDGNPLDPHMQSPLVSNIYFNFWQKTAQLSPPVAWIQTSNIDLTQGGSPEVKYTWDGNVQVYHIESSALSTLSDHTNGTQVDSYLIRTELRNIGTVQMGVDYYAIGAPLLTTGSNSLYRNVPFTPDPIEVSDINIPDDAQIEKALLFWSAWKDNKSNIFNDGCGNFDNWIRSGTSPYTNTSWKVTSGKYAGYYGGGGDNARYLTSKVIDIIDEINDLNEIYDLNLDKNSCKAVVSWDQSVAALSSSLFTDTCANFNFFTAGSAWSISDNKFRGNTWDISNPGRDIVKKSVNNLGTGSGTIKVSWDQSVTKPTTTTLLTDSCSSANFNTYWTNGGDWSYNSSAQNYKGHHSSGNPDTARYLTAKNIIDLDNLGTGTVNISFDTPILASATPVSVAPLNPDTCVTFNNWTQGSAWSLNSGNFKAAGANKPTADRDLILKNPLDLSSYGSTGTIDIILDTPVISPIESNAFSESCNNLNSWTNTGAWSISSNTFRGNCINNSNNDGTLTLTSPLSLVQYGSTADIVVSWKQFTDGNLGSSQGLNFAYTLDGTNWTNTQIFRNDNPTTPYTFTISNQTLTNNFKIRFIVVESGTNNRYIYLDDISVKVVHSGYTAADGLDLSYSLDGGNNWVAKTVFTGNMQSLTTAFSIPSVTLPSNFLLKFSLSGFNQSWQYCTIDNIHVKVASTYTLNDGLDIAYSLNGGSTWTTKPVFRGSDTESATVSFDVPYDPTHNKLLMRFGLVGFNAGWQYCCIDDIVIKATPSYTKSDGLDFYYSVNGGSTWTKKIVFRGPDLPPSSAEYNVHFDSATNNNILLFKFSLVGFNNPGLYCHLDNIKVQNTYSDTDTIYISFSKDGGVNWSTPPVQGYYGDIGTDPQTFSTLIPNDYLTENFKMRFYLSGFDSNGKYCYVDNISIDLLTPDLNVNFKVDTHQTELTTSQANAQTMLNSLGGYSYSCWSDVTDIITTYAETKPDGNCPGQGNYSVSGVDYNTGSQISYAGWSLILIYKSPETKNHMVFLYKDFTNSNQDDFNGVNVDFDHDGKPGGSITGFLVPQQDAEEINAGKVTCFIGEGDDHYAGDFLAINAPENYWSHPKDIPDRYKLWDGTSSTDEPGSNTKSSPNNIWDNTMLVQEGETLVPYTGIDIDTLGIDPSITDPKLRKYITWDSGLLKPGDTSAHIDLFTKTDVFNLVYIVFSFRSVTTTGSALNYHIR